MHYMIYRNDRKVVDEAAHVKNSIYLQSLQLLICQTNIIYYIFLGFR